MTDDIQDRLAEIEARAAAATAGPWEDDHWHDDDEMPHTVVRIGTHLVVNLDNLDDAAFIAAARSDVPWLCSQLRESLAEAEKLRAELARVAPFLAAHGACGYSFRRKP